MGLLDRPEGQQVAVSPDVETEFAVEILRDPEIGDCKVKVINGMNAERAWTASWLDESLDRRHRIFSPVAVARSVTNP